jgi:hypothetical protein
MKLATGILAAALATTLVAATAGAAPYREEHVSGGVLDLAWTNGFDTSNNMQPATLDPSDPAYANPSGDHTVAVATNAVADSGGIIVTSIDSQGINDYIWEGWMFTGNGDTRRGIIVRATPAENAKNFYMLVMESGMVRIRFRKLVGQTPTTLGDWFLNTLPPGVPQLNSWHHLKVEAAGGNFRCWWDDYELTGPGGTIVDTELPTGNVGCYNFRFDLGGIPVLFDDLLLTDYATTPTTAKTWGAIKRLYR